MLMLPTVVVAQLLLRNTNGVTSTMQRADVIEIHSDEDQQCHEQTMVIWGSKKTGKVDSVVFMFTDNVLIYFNIEFPTREDIALAERIALHRVQQNISGEKIYLLTDPFGDRYTVRVLSGDTGYLIFINNMSARYPQFVLSFSPINKIKCP